jgi:hypothetical protein
MREINSKFHPFEGGDVVNSGNHSRLYDLENNPEYFAKHIKVRIGDYKNFREPKDFAELRSNFEADLGEVKNYLGKFLPEFHITYLAETSGVDSQKDSDYPERSAKAANGYMFMKKVAEEKDQNASVLTEKAKQLDDFVGQAGELFISSYKDGKGLSLDLKPEHFLFGTTKGKPLPQLYFVDLYPRFHLSKNIFESRLSEITAPYVNNYSFPKVRDIFNRLEHLD